VLSSNLSLSYLLLAHVQLYLVGRRRLCSLLCSGSILGWRLLRRRRRRPALNLLSLGQDSVAAASTETLALQRPARFPVHFLLSLTHKLTDRQAVKPTDQQPQASSDAAAAEAVLLNLVRVCTYSTALQLNAASCLSAIPRG
jgi:hypothetical protein